MVSSSSSSSGFSFLTISTLVSSSSALEGVPSSFLDLVSLTEKLESRPSPRGSDPGQLSFSPSPLRPGGSVALRGRPSPGPPSSSSLMEISLDTLPPMLLLLLLWRGSEAKWWWCGGQQTRKWRGR